MFRLVWLALLLFNFLFGMLGLRLCGFRFLSILVLLMYWNLLSIILLFESDFGMFVMKFFFCWLGECKVRGEFLREIFREIFNCFLFFLGLRSFNFKLLELFFDFKIERYLDCDILRRLILL